MTTYLKAMAFLMLTTVAIPSASFASEIGYKGAKHNGAFLRASKTDAQGTGVIVTVEFECRKNWGGNSSGEAFIQAVSIETQEYKEISISCSVNGGADGATKSKTERKGIFFKDAKTVVLVPTIDHRSKSNWNVWRQNVENTVKSALKKSTDPTTLINAAKAAGIAAVAL